MRVEEQRLKVVSSEELMLTPVVKAWSVTKCERASCPFVHVIMFGDGDEMLAHLILGKNDAGVFMQDVLKVMDCVGRGVN